MAEFKLGRLRFVWKNSWQAGTVYYQDDVIALGGKIYICVIGHTSNADFFEDLDITPSKWNLVSDGQTWKGDWQPQIRYVYGDIVKYGGRLYICQEVHTSAADSTTGLEADLASWELFAEGLEWKGNWQTSFDYKANDIVKYGGSTYVCNNAHISAATEASGLEADLSKWDLFNQGFDYKDQWAADTRYKVNDVVRFGANTYIATGYHTSASQFATDSAYWNKFVDGFQYESEWFHERSYQAGDVVKYGGNQYIALTENTNKIPSTQTDDWNLFSEGFRYRGDWGDDSSNIDYLVGDLVRYGSYTYRCILDHNGQEPPNATYWERFNTGLDWRGEWLDDQFYYEGDVVRFGDNSYVCINSHISEGDDYSTETDVQPGGGAQNSRPDLDTTGTYWNLIALGSETSVLTTTGDLVYYGGAGPTRLPIGTDGQILTVSPAGIPQWATLDYVDDVYFVAEHGTDIPAPTYGKSIDRPFKTIRYAAQQIERGARNPGAAKLLELNRRFIQREIVEWTDAQITAGTSPFTTDFDYDSAKCERDMGFIVDALIWDITHGGNVRSREAALSYVNDTVGSPYLTQKTQTVASINYGLEVIADVLAQTDPDVNYQATNGDNSTAVVDQYKDANLQAEDILSDITGLVGIITDAITAGVADDIPARLIRTTLIRVSTGYYKEVLPIIVPAECCIMGDELRSTNVQPRTVYNSVADLTPSSDFQYTYQGLKHMEDIIGDIVTGSSVSAQSNTTEIQDQSWPYAETDVVAPAVTKTARNIRRKIDVGLGQKLEATLTPSYNMAVPQFGYLRDLNLVNKAFIQAEIVGYLNDQYPNLDYSRTKCKQDVGFILDALAYDLTYGGNWQSVKAGEAYWEGNNLQIASSEKTATLAAYGYLRDLVQTVGRNITVTPPYQDDVEQIGGTAGNTTASNTARDLINDIIAIVTNGSGTVDITYPDLSSANASVRQSFETAESNLSVVQEKTIDFINENFGSFKYKSAKCRRDLGLIIGDTAYDVALGTNYNAVFIGQAYQRPINAYNLTEQRVETVGAIRNARDELVETVTTDGSSASGSSNAATRIRTAYNEIVDIINNGSGNADTLSFPSPAGVDQNRVDAKDNLVANKEFIQAEIIAWISAQIVANAGNPGSIWYNFTYDSEKCERDVGFIVDAMCYDILYGGTMASTRIAQSYFTGTTAYPAGQADQTAAAYDRLATVMFYVVQEDTGSWTKTTAEVQTTPGTPATATEGALIRDTQMQIIEDVITAGNLNSLPTIVYPDITWADAEYQTAFSNINSDKNDVIKSTIQYITTTYNDFVYDHTKCSRDLGIILQAAKYDTLLGTNFASINAGISYLRAPSSKVIGDQKTATLAANEYARQLLATYLNATATTGLNITWEWVQDTVWAGSYEGGNSAVSDIEVWNAIRQLELNKEFIVEEVLNYVDNTFRARVTGVLEATDEIEIDDTSWLSYGMPIKFYNDEDAGDSTDAVVNANLLETETYYVRDITSATTFTISNIQYGAVIDQQNYGENFVVEKAYQYNRELCARDVREYIDAIKYDLQWPQEWKRTYNFTNVEIDNNGTTTQSTDTVTIYLSGFYRTGLATRYYVNSVIGSQEEDMYYLRNGTGLRLQTLDGLRGDLGPENAYGTQRPTAGAYASLDPGWGPDDQRVWITARSPYVQNLTTFGFAAIGQKIDGALHNGGNDSIVSNDFTQVISDGIGAWVTNNGRAELVSVFTYYSHIGYLCEAGGRIRGTNGNNSYGKFGSVAEGVDPDESPVTAIVDNRLQYNAVVSNVFTDGADEILQLEYSHAGNDYTEANINIFGAGDSEELLQEDFRDEAVNNVRIIEIDDSTGNPDATAGGSGYLVVTNTAQTGSTTSITLAATDGNSSTAYPGMKLIVTGGAAVGQYGIVDTYNSGSKEATIVKESDGTAGWDHVVPGTTIIAPNSSSTYLIEPRAQFTAPTKTNSQQTGVSGSYGTSSYIETSAQYSGVAVTSQSDGTGATFDVTRNGDKYYIELVTAGTGYTRLDTITMLGSNLGGADTTNDIVVTITAVDAETGAITAYDFTGIGRKGYFVAVQSPSNASQYSVDGISWTAGTVASNNVWLDMVPGKIDDGTTTFKQSYAIVLGVNTGTNAVVSNYSLDGISWTASSPAGLTATTYVSGAFGQIGTAISRFVVISDGQQDVAYSDNGGQSWTVTASALPSTGFSAVEYGAGKFVAIKQGSQEIAYSEDGVTWVQVLLGMPNTNTWDDIVFGNGRFVATSSLHADIAYSLDGTNWTLVTSALVDNRPLKIAYGQGMFVVSSTSTNELSYSEDGVYWPSGGYTLSNTYTSGINGLCFGNPGRTPKFVGFQNSSGTAVLNAKIGATTKGRVGVASEQVFEVRITDPGSGYGSTPPTLTITDPNNIDDVLFTVRLNNAVLGQPTFIARGSGFIQASAEIDAASSNGNADFFQDGQFIAVRRLSATPVNGSNVVFDSLPGQVFKLVNTVSLVGLIEGDKVGFLQISPPMEIEDAPLDGDGVTMRIRFSQVRLTGHDFLDIGTGNFAETNYPGDPFNDPDPDNETKGSNGGRVFFTSTDQDGNFKVGDLFSIEQSTGVATLNAEAFNIAGLQELSLGEVTLGGNSASITEFSTDPFFTANSDTIVPTQRAIKAYIEAQIGGGGASLIVNSVTAGDIFINGTQITTISGATINIKANVNFQGAVLGRPLAYNYFLR